MSLISTISGIIIIVQSFDFIGAILSWTAAAILSWTAAAILSWTAAGVPSLARALCCAHDGNPGWYCEQSVQSDLARPQAAINHQEVLHTGSQAAPSLR
jgi:hypothetical protein